MNIDYTKSSRYELIDWIKTRRKDFKGIKTKNVDILINVLVHVAPWSTTEQFRELYVYVCESFGIYKDEKHWVKKKK